MIGFVRCQCIIYHTHSLKEKRGIIKSLIVRMKQQLNVSTAELDFHDVWQRTEFGIATVAVDRKRAEQELQKALNMIDSDERLEVTNIEFEWL